MKITAEPRSDQWNADDFLGGPRTFTIAGVKDGAAEQKYDIVLEGEARAWRPPLTMLRVLIAAWGDDSDAWTGRRVTLYQDPTVKFGRDTLGGIRISHLSHLDKPLQIKVTTTRGKRETVSVQPLRDQVECKVDDIADGAFDLDAAIAECKGDTDKLRALYGKVQAMKAPQEALDKIRAAATPAPDETPAA